jgi:hypothetical protein
MEIKKDKQKREKKVVFGEILRLRKVQNVRDEHNSQFAAYGTRCTPTVQY